MLNETLGKWHFWIFVIGFHLTFDSMHIPGLLGMPRRVYTYEAGRGWETWNMISSIGAIFQAVAILIFVYNMICVLFKGRSGRKRSVGCVDARMGHDFAAARIQFRNDPNRAEPPAALGHQASGGSGLEVRVKMRRGRGRELPMSAAGAERNGE